MVMRNLSRAHLATILISGLLACGLLSASPLAAAGPVAWNDKDSAELAAALHHMHDVWNSGNIKALKDLIVGDEVLVTFELDPETHAPIQLRSKRDIDRFVDDIVKAIDKEADLTQLEMPQLHCRATDSFGICTEECTIHFQNAAGKIVRTDKLWSTAFAVKYPDGWRWIQWHMSVAEPTVPLLEGRPFAKSAKAASDSH
jgi:hypothetical protein